jgi:SAM-dependent methyltransferase
VNRRLALACLAAAGTAWGASNDEAVWQEYLAWYRKQPESVADLRQAWLDYLKRSGVSDPDARARLRTVDRLSRERRDELRPAFFDRTYSAPAPRFNSKPNALLVETVRGLKPGRALDVDMGQGRNAVYLATQGWDATGFDYAAEGVAAAGRAAEAAKVPLQALVRRNEDFDFGREQWDLILLCYAWLPLAAYAQRLVDALKPGGLLVIEALMDESGSDRAAPWLPKPDELPKTFTALRILRYEDTRAQADWSWRPERIARLVARK